MKEKILKLIYLRYRAYFYHFFDEEFLSGIPDDVREPAMAWLANGREKLEKWAYFMSKFLQRRMITDPDKIKTYEGMMLMLKLLMVHIMAYHPKPQEMGSAPDEENRPKDPVEELQAALKRFKEGPAVEPVE
jgi:hypothetical protein